jgi:anthranilate synthase component II
MIILIDHYDSFTYNLYQYLSELKEDVHIVRYDQISLLDISNISPRAIVLSPGPGNPEEISETIDVIKTFYQTIPILGICLGHQAIAYAFGSEITEAKQIMHGKVSNITHNGNGIFAYLTQPLEVMRYHSLVIQKESLSTEFEILASSLDDKEIMAIKHKDYPLFGMQFHPESIGTKHGKQLLDNFLSLL